MSWDLPGLDARAFKRLAKRLQVELAQAAPPVVYPLHELHDALARALGHADRHAALKKLGAPLAAVKPHAAAHFASPLLDPPTFAARCRATGDEPAALVRLLLDGTQRLFASTSAAEARAWASEIVPLAALVYSRPEKFESHWALVRERDATVPGALLAAGLALNTAASASRALIRQVQSGVLWERMLDLPGVGGLVGEGRQPTGEDALLMGLLRWASPQALSEFLPSLHLESTLGALLRAGRGDWLDTIDAAALAPALPDAYRRLKENDSDWLPPASLEEQHAQLVRTFHRIPPPARTPVAQRLLDVACDRGDWDLMLALRPHLTEWNAQSNLTRMVGRLAHESLTVASNRASAMSVNRDRESAILAQLKEGPFSDLNKIHLWGDGLGRLANPAVLHALLAESPLDEVGHRQLLTSALLCSPTRDLETARAAGVPVDAFLRSPAGIDVLIPAAQANNAGVVDVILESLPRPLSHIHQRMMGLALQVLLAPHGDAALHPPVKDRVALARKLLAAGADPVATLMHWRPYAELAVQPEPVASFVRGLSAEPLWLNRLLQALWVDPVRDAAHLKAAAERLIAAGADVHAPVVDIQGSSPSRTLLTAMLASPLFLHQRLDRVRALLELGADPAQVDGQGKSPLDVLATSQAFIESSEREALTQLLTPPGAPISRPRP